MDGMGVDIQFQGCNLQVMNPEKGVVPGDFCITSHLLGTTAFPGTTCLGTIDSQRRVFLLVGELLGLHMCLTVTHGVSKGQPVMLSKKEDFC